MGIAVRPINVSLATRFLHSKSSPTPCVVIGGGKRALHGQAEMWVDFYQGLGDNERSHRHTQQQQQMNGPDIEACSSSSFRGVTGSKDCTKEEVPGITPLITTTLAAVYYYHPKRTLPFCDICIPCNSCSGFL